MAHGRSTDTDQAEQPGGLSVTGTTTDGISVLTVTGEIDHHTGDQLLQALDVSDTTRPRVVIDLSRVTFMDSSGINILIVTYRAIAAADGWLRLAAPTEPVLRILQLTGVDDLIECCPTLGEALTP